jgi:NADH-quinone oxidoreductase subunit J
MEGSNGFLWLWDGQNLMSLELLIFLIVAAIAIFSAAFMLVSHNAVHSALFLVTNMICLAFFYLILNAPFLAMVQITVYAGAIMVLFLFVIMLLGADKLGEAPGRFKWLAGGSVGLATLFMLTAFVAIVNGNVDLLKPIPHPPKIRVVDASPTVGHLAVTYGSGAALVDSLSYKDISDYKIVAPGNYTLSVTDVDQAKNLTTFALMLNNETITTLVISPNKVIVVPEDISPITADGQFRYTAVNALPGTGVANLLQLNPSDATNAQVAAANLNYGDTLPITALASGDYSFSWEVNGQRVVGYPEQAIKADSEQLFILIPDIASGSANALQLSQRNQAAFGSPQQMGEQLLSTYLLPFELVSLLLLGAMVGAIVLTREDYVRRDRKRVVVSHHMNRFNQTAEALGIDTTVTEHAAVAEVQAESAAD